MTKKTDKDWAAIEADFRAGTLSNRQLAKKYGVSESAIRKKAEAGGWVRTKCAPAHQPPRQPEAEILPPARRPAAPTADEPVPPQDPAALSRDLVLRLLQELDITTANLGDIEDAIYEETKDDQSGRRRSAMLKAVSLPARAMTLKTLLQSQQLATDTAAGGAKQGKKEERQQAAAAAAQGRFAPPAPPKLVVDNG